MHLLSNELVRNALWDVFLGVVPVVLAWILVAGVRGTSVQWRWLWIPVGLVWLAFLPNTAYLLTEIRHAPQRTEGLLVPKAGADDVRQFLLWSGFYLAFSGSGLVLFVLAIRPVLALAGTRRWIGWMALPLLCWLTAIGIYVGLRIRYNSWDLVTRPEEVLRTVQAAVLGPGHSAGYILGTALFLWLAYLVADIWLEGLKQRVAGLRRGSGTSKPRRT